MYVFSKVLVIFFLTNICFVYGRGGGRGGGGRGSSRGSSSHGSSHSYSHSYSHPSPSYSHPSPSYSHPSPSYSHPSPSYSHPSPSYSHPSPSYSHPSPSYSHPSPSISHPAVSHPASLSYPAYHPLPSVPAYRPIGWNAQGSTNTNTRPIGFHTENHPSSGPVGPPKQVSGVGSSSSHNGPEITRPIGFVAPGSPGHSTGTAGQPVGPPKTIAGVGNSASGSHYGEKPPAYNPHYNPAGYGSPPSGYNFPPPAYSPAGHPAYSPGNYHAPPAYSPGNYHAPPAYTPHGTPGVTVINNNYHPPAYVPTYHYTTTDTGSGHLGFFLGYSMGRLTSPSYHYHSYGSYYDPLPRYDHYTVHHYYHNSGTVPKEATIQPNAVVTCVGDSGSICPANTTSLCTNNGAVMCVASASATVPCRDVDDTNCVKSSIPCLKNSTSMECIGKLRENSTVSVTIPCISTAKIFANVSVVNNNIVIVDTDGNGTIGNSTIGNSTITAGNSTISTGNSTISTGNSTITTTPLPVTTTPQPTTPQTFCVTILALPAERKIPESEKLFNSADDIFGKFAVKVLGLA